MASPKSFSMQGALNVGIFSLETGYLEAYLEDCLTTNVELTAEKVYSLGKGGSFVTGFSHSKRIPVTVKHGYPTSEILAIQSGQDIIIGTNTNVMKFEKLTVSSNASTTSKVALGTVGEEIGAIYTLSGKSFDEKFTQAAATVAVAATNVVEAASAGTDILTTTSTTAIGADANALSINLTTAVDDTLAVTASGSVITIALANITAANNTATLIEAAIQALVTVDDVDVSAFTCVAGGNWDTAAIATGEVGAVDFTGGVDAVSTGTFTYTFATKGIAFYPGDIADGTTIIVAYNYTADSSAQTIKMDTDTFSGNKKVVMTGIAIDNCTDKSYKAQLIFRKMSISDSMTLSLDETGDPVVMDVMMEALASCESDTLMEWVIFDEDLAI